MLPSQLSFLNDPIKSRIQEIESSSFLPDTVSLSILRDDLVHPDVSGNKFRKLKYNILQAHRQRKKTLLTFGGAYSNHIAATAAAGKEFGFNTIGIIRGEELSGKMDGNPTLRYARSCGMRLEFITRDAYKRKTTESFLNSLYNKFGDFYILPEGGTNKLAVAGCKEILNDATENFDYICVAVGTGGTLAGIVEAALPHQRVIGFSSLKGTFQKKEVEQYTNNIKYEITDSCCFGGYAKIDSELIRFINEFKNTTGIPLDPVYTGKMMYGVYDRIANFKFKQNSRILAIHTGGLQGIPGMNKRLKRKNLPQLN